MGGNRIALVLARGGEDPMIAALVTLGLVAVLAAIVGAILGTRGTDGQVVAFWVGMLLFSLWFWSWIIFLLVRLVR